MLGCLNDELEVDEVYCVLFKVLSQQGPGQTKVEHEEAQSE
jgi:hypothetical protein